MRLLCGLSLDPVVGFRMLHCELLQDRDCSLLIQVSARVCVYTDYTDGFPNDKVTFIISIGEGGAV